MDASFQSQGPRREMREKILAIAGRMESEATKRVSKKQPIEKRWIEDLLQYHARYDSETENDLKKAKQSRLFINQTRSKTDAMSARLMDLLFPTDDRNWGIGPTPVPELTEAASQAVAQAQGMRQQMEAAAQAGQPIPPELEQQTNAAEQAAAQLEAQIEEAKRRSNLMTEEIDDQLKESNYQAVMRDVIDCAAKLGIGVAKGPVTGDRIRKGWKQDKGTGQYNLQMSEGDQPAMRFVDPWSFFPDMDAACVEDGEGNFERHLMNRKKLRSLAKLPGFDKDSIRRLLMEKPRASAPSYLADLRNITGTNESVTADLYHVWEYSGCLDYEDMRDLALAMAEFAQSDDDREGYLATVREMEDLDPLTEVNAVVWFCQNEVLKFSIYPYDSGECLYSVFCLAKDEASIFGYGVPTIMRDPQRSLNAAWRAMMDNAGLSAGPQIVIAEEFIEPTDGSWVMRPRKTWKAKAGIPKDRTAFEVFNIPSMQGELAAIVELSLRFIDMMTQMPALAQGEQGSGVTKTAQGMAILMNSANVVFRRIVKNFDDDMTTPNIRRFYDWNMQHNPKEEIKGDYEVDARGSSVLLVREMQAQNLMILAMQLGGHPVYGPMLKARDLIKKVFQAHMIPADEVLLKQDEIDAIMARAEAAAQEQATATTGAIVDPVLEQRKIDLEEMKIESQIEIANMEAATRKEIEYLKRETQMMLFAEKMNMTIDTVNAKLIATREQMASKERMFAAEAAVTERAGPSGGGNF
jgi:hypothetical protein